MSDKSKEYIQEILLNIVFLIASLWAAFGAEDFRVNIIGLFLSGFFFIKGYKLNKKLVKLQNKDVQVKQPDDNNT